MDKVPLIPLKQIFSAGREIISAKNQEEVIDALFNCVTSGDKLDEITIYSIDRTRPSTLVQTRYWRSGSLDYLPKNALISLHHLSEAYHMPTDSILFLESIAADKRLPEYLRDTAIACNLDSTVIIPIKYQHVQFGYLQLTSSSLELFKNADLNSLFMLCDQVGLVYWQLKLENERETLDQLNHALNHAVTQEDAAEAVVLYLAQYAQVQNCRLFLLDSGTNKSKLLIEHIPTFSDWAFFAGNDDPLIKQFSRSQEPIIIYKDAPGSFQMVADRYLAPFNYRTSLIVPIFNQLTLNGFIILDSEQSNYLFNPDLINFTRTIAKRFEIRYENLLLYDEAFNRAQELIQLNQIGEKLSSTLDTKILAEIVCHSTQQLIPAPIFLLAMVSMDEKKIDPILFSSKGGETFTPNSQKAAGYSAILAQIQSQETTICWKQDPLLKELIDVWGQSKSKRPISGAFAPIIQSGFGEGFIALLSYDSEIYQPDDIQVLRAIANQTGLCLSNSALLKKSENHVSELRALFNVTQALANGISADERISNSLRTLHLSLEKSDVSLILMDNEFSLETVAHHKSEENGSSNPDAIYESRITRALTNDAPPLSLSESQFIDLTYNEVKTGSNQIIVPFSLSSGETGGLVVQNLSTNINTEQNLRLLQTLSVSFAATLENGRLFEQLEEANEQLRELDRLKTQFLANMSHELRTPLNSIIGFSKILLRGMVGPISPEQEADINSIYQSGEHLLRLINDILDLTKLDAGKMQMEFEPVDVVELGTKALNTTRALIREEYVSLELNVADQFPHIEADPLRIRQILLNLLSNAAKFTIQGKISLQLKRDPSDGNLIELSVTDTGTGIDPKDLPKLFELFEQGKQARTTGAAGTGLGLPIVKELIQLHNGTISVDSIIDKGTTVTVKLPISQPDPPPVVEEDESENLSSEKLLIPKKKKKKSGKHPAILIVDDEPAVLTLYQRYLGEQPNELICAINGLEALTHMRNRAKEIGLVLLDIHMPGLTGWEVLAEMRQTPELTDIPVAICSLDIDAERAYESGAQMVLAKPIISEDLTRVLDLAAAKN